MSIRTTTPGFAREDDDPMSTSPTMAPAPESGTVALGRRADPSRIVFFELVAGDLREWWVVEVDARHVPGARGARCLLFSSASCIRRVWSYPANWRTLDDAALASLSWQR